MSSIKDAIAASIKGLTEDDNLDDQQALADGLSLPETEETPLPDGEDELLAADPEPEPEPEAEPEEAPVVEEPVVEEPVADPKTPAAPKADDFAKEHGIAAKDRRGRENKIPYSAVANRIVPNAVKKAQTTWEKDTLAPVVKINNEYRDRLEEVGKTETIMFGNPQRFLEMLAKSVPGYAELLQQRPAAAPATKAPAETEDPEPGPDGRDAQGNITGYTQEGLKALRAWDRRQTARQVAADLNKDLKPIRDRVSAQEKVEQLEQTVTRQLDEAYKWPGFKEHEAAIFKLFTDEKLTIKQAYDKHLYALSKPDMAALEADLRKKFMAELKKAPPRSTSVVGGGSSSAARTESEATPAPGQSAVNAAIRASLRRK